MYTTGRGRIWNAFRAIAAVAFSSVVASCGGGSADPVFGAKDVGASQREHALALPAGAVAVPAIAAGIDHSLALKSDGTVWAWGSGPWGQLGNVGTFSSSVPVQVSGAGGTGVLTGVTAIAAGNRHSLALKSDGTVWAWGYGDGGRLGNNGTVSSSVPVQVFGAGGTGVLTGVTAIAAGNLHSLALKSDGTVWAWGYGFNGQLGNNSTADSSVPVQVVGAAGTGVLTGVTTIAAGFYHSLALKSDGTVWAWGQGFAGVLGNNSSANSSVPVQVVGAAGTGMLTGVTTIAAGIYHSLALKSDGTVWAWGYNFNGQLGNNGTADSSVPVQVVGAAGTGVLTGVITIAAGDVHSLAMKSDGTVWAWGHNISGQLGNNSTIDSSVPVQVLGPGGVGFLNLGTGTPPVTQITFVATGRVTNVLNTNDLLSLYFPIEPKIGDLISYEYTFESATPSDGQVLPFATRYYGSIVSSRLIVGANPPYVFPLSGNGPGEGNYIYVYGGASSSYYTIVGSLSPRANSFSIDTTNGPAGYFPNNALPVMPPDLSQFTSNGFGFATNNGGSNDVVTGTLDTITLVGAPPPPTACASQATTWSVGTSSCSASYSGGQSGSSVTLSDVIAPDTGTVTASCTNGALTLAAPTCVTAPPPPLADCASQVVPWSVGSSSCSTTYLGGHSGTISTLTDSTAPVTGTATASCTNGQLTVTPQTCVTESPPPPPPPLLPVVTLSPSSLLFGEITVGADSLAQGVVLKNTGTANLVLGVFTLGGTNPGDYLFVQNPNPCSNATLPPSASCSFNVSFGPTAAGLRIAAATITSNAAGSPHSVTLTGTGVLIAPPPTNTYYGLFVGAKDPGDWKSETVNFARNAQTMASVFASRPYSKANVITGDLTPNDSGKPNRPITVQRIRDVLTTIRLQMVPGDTLTLYINNHGGSAAPGATKSNETGLGDEAIYVGDYLYDNELADMLRQFSGYRVSVFLDACHGGGFWGGTDAAEYGPLGKGFNDLNQLTNISLYSGASEGKLEYSVLGISFWGRALKEAWESPVPRSGQELATFLAVRTLDLAAESTPVWYSLGLGDPVPADLSLIETFQANSVDFDMNAPLMSAPEPRTQMSNLLAAVTNVGSGSSLANKIKLAQTYYALPDLASTCAVLTDFIREVNAQTGKKVSLIDAERFIASARFTKASIVCN